MARLKSRSSTPERVVVIDDDPRYVRSMSRLLKVSGIETDGETNPTAAVELVRRLRPDVVLVDYFMPELTGDEVIARIRDFDPLVPCLVVSGYAGGRTADLLRNPEVQALHGKADNPAATVGCVRMWSRVRRTLDALDPDVARPLFDLLTSLFRIPAEGRYERALHRLAAFVGVDGTPDALALSSDGPVLAGVGAYEHATSLAETGTVGLQSANPETPATWSAGHLVVRWPHGVAVVRADEPSEAILDLAAHYVTVFETIQTSLALPRTHSDDWTGP